MPIGENLSIQRGGSMKTLTGIIKKGEKYYIGECVEIDVITQGKTIDETIKNLREAVALYFEGENIEKLEIPEEPSIIVSLEIPEYASRK